MPVRICFTVYVPNKDVEGRPFYTRYMSVAASAAGQWERHSPLILAAEDNLDDVFLLKRAFKAAGLTQGPLFVPNGILALNYLKGQGRYADRTAYPFPDLVLLDAHMPGISGLETLQQIRDWLGFSQLPVVLLSGGLAPAQIAEASAFGAETWIKPMEIARLVTIAQRIVALATEPHRRLLLPAEPALQTRQSVSASSLLPDNRPDLAENHRFEPALHACSGVL